MVQSLRPMNLKGVIAPMKGMGMLHCLPGRGQSREGDEVAQRIREDVGNRGDGAGLNDDEHRPAVEVADEPVVALVEVDVLAAGVAEHARDLGDRQGPEERHDAGDDPDEDEQLGRAELGWP